MYTYAIVEFSGPRPREVEIVCLSWLNQTETATFWPLSRCSASEIRRLQKENVDPEEDWVMFKIRRVVDKLVSYSDARKKLRIAEDTSDLQTDIDAIDGTRRKRKVVRRRRNSSASSSEGSSSMSLLQPIRVPKVLFHKGKKTEMNVCEGKVSIENTNTCGTTMCELSLYTQNLCVDETVDRWVPTAASKKVNKPDSVVNYIAPAVIDVTVEDIPTRAEFTALQTIIFRQHVETRELLKENNRLLQLIVMANQLATSVPFLPSNMPTLPLSSVAKVCSMEDWLAADETNVVWLTS